MVFSFDMIKTAAGRLDKVVAPTSLLESDRVNEKLQARVLLKPECLQKTGSFKLRGAYNKIASLTDAERAAGVVAFSSGNHAQGVAAAAKALGVRATVIMPEDAPLIKQRNTREYGAEVILYDRYTESREELARITMEESGAILVPPYDDHEIMAGQGTVGLELAHQLEEIDVVAEHLICPAGGGGLIAGISTAFSKLSPATKIYSAEPENFDDTKRSLECGERVENEPGFTSICDSIVTQMPGILTFDVNKSLLSGGYALTELEVKHAMLLLFEEFKIVTEPGGAVAFAAALCNRMEFEGNSLAIVISGGNIDYDRFCEIVCGRE